MAHHELLDINFEFPDSQKINVVCDRCTMVYRTPGKLLRSDAPHFCDQCAETLGYNQDLSCRIKVSITQNTTPAIPRDYSAHKCTFAITGTTFHIQRWFHCENCFPGNSDKGVCVVCAKDCVENGHILAERCGLFYCDKGVVATEPPKNTETMTTSVKII